MDINELKEQWKYEESYAFRGWDFSHIRGRWDSGSLPWDYSEILLSYLKNTDKLLDMGTGGGEFLLSLKHPYKLTTVTEAYPPNVEFCKKELEPLGITVVQVYGDNRLPFENKSFDIIINRHESFDPPEVYRILKSGGYFITQQVGGKNDNDLSHRLIDHFVPKFSGHSLKNNISLLENAGFEIIKSEEAFTPIRFFDVGALVYFAKIIAWEFPDFSVETSLDRLFECQKEIEEKGFIQGTEHRFIIVAKKL
jgi:SAM-dependent methyltransferase